nr:transporter associated domain-containing protein [Actinomadura sp. CNU-125]
MRHRRVRRLHRHPHPGGPRRGTRRRDHRRARHRRRRARDRPRRRRLDHPRRVHIDEVERAVDHRLPEGGYETLAGLVIAALGDLPEPGTELDVELPADPADLAYDEEPPVRFVHVEVLEVDNHVPSSVRLAIVEGGR